jgi:hypothetical protein
MGNGFSIFSVINIYLYRVPRFQHELGEQGEQLGTLIPQHFSYKLILQSGQGRLMDLVPLA